MPNKKNLSSHFLNNQPKQRIEHPGSTNNHGKTQKPKSNRPIIQAPPQAHA